MEAPAGAAWMWALFQGQRGGRHWVSRENTVLARAAATKCLGLGRFASSSPGGQTSKVKEPGAGGGLGEASLLGVQTAVFSLCPHMGLSPWSVS